MIRKSKSLVIIAISFLISIGFIFQSCEKENSLNEFELESFKSEYGLKTIKDDNVIEFNSLDEAKLFLEKLNDNKKESHKMSFNTKSPGKDSFSLSYRGRHFNGPRLKSGSTEQTGWETSTDAGNFSDFDLNFNTSGNNVIDPSSINLSTSGFRIGWAYTQNGVTMIDGDSFVISGTVSWGLGVANATVGYDQDFDLRIDIDWSTNTATWTEL